MLISHTLKCIFIHVQKTGGSSIEAALRRMDPASLSQVPGTEYKHVWARDLRKHVDPEVWDRYFKFGFVRNPWDRLVAWHNIISVLLSCQDRDRWMAQIAAVREVDRCGGQGFADFIRRCTATFHETRGERVSFACTQLEHLSDDDGKLMVDFVGRFENLDGDFALVLERLNRTAPRLPHRNVHWHRHYSRYYTPELVELVRSRFRDDIQRFGYGFEKAGRLRDALRAIALTGASARERACRVAARARSPEVPEAPREG